MISVSFATFIGAIFGALILNDMDHDWLGCVDLFMQLYQCFCSLFLAFAAGTFLYIMSSTVFRELSSKETWLLASCMAGGYFLVLISHLIVHG